MHPHGTFFQLHLLSPNAATSNELILLGCVSVLKLELPGVTGLPSSGGLFIGGSSSSALAIPAASTSLALPSPSPIRSPAALLSELIRDSAGRKEGDMLRISAQGDSSAGRALTPRSPPGWKGEMEGEVRGLGGRDERMEARVGS